MISASDARARIAQHRSPHESRCSSSYRRLERLVDQAIEEACERDLWPCRLDVPTQIDAEVARAIVGNYGRDGKWEIEVTSNEDGVRILLQDPRSDPEARLEWIRAHIERLAELPVDWGGSERPSRLAIGLAVGIATEMDQRGHRFCGAAPIADGGVALEYGVGRWLGRFDVYNDGGVVAVTRGGARSGSVIAELPIPSAIDQISSHLDGSGSEKVSEKVSEKGSEKRAEQGPDAGGRP